MALKILRKTVKRFFKYTNSFKSYDEKTVPMQCPGGIEKRDNGTKKRGIGSEKRGILEPRMEALPNAMLFGSDATLFGSNALLLGSSWTLPIKNSFWSYLWNALVYLKNLCTAFLRILRAESSESL